MKNSCENAVVTILKEDSKYVLSEYDVNIMINKIEIDEQDTLNEKFEYNINKEIKKIIKKEQDSKPFLEDEMTLLINIDTTYANQLNLICNNNTRNYNIQDGMKIKYKINFINTEIEVDNNYDIQVNVENTVLQSRKSTTYIVSELEVYNFFQSNYNNFDIISILENNVRMPLGNKKLKKEFINTIIDDSEMFFFKNNGIVGMFSEYEDMSTHFSFKEFKILNGGQTLSTLLSIYEILFKLSYKNLNKNINEVFDENQELKFVNEEAQITLNTEEIITFIEDGIEKIEVAKKLKPKNYLYLDVIVTLIEQIMGEYKKLIKEEIREKKLKDSEKNLEVNELEIKEMYKELTISEKRNRINYLYCREKFKDVSIGMKLIKNNNNNKYINDISYALNNQTAVNASDRWSNSDFVIKFNSMDSPIEIVKKGINKTDKKINVGDVIEYVLIALKMSGTAKNNKSKNVDNFFEDMTSIINEDNIEFISEKAYQENIEPVDVVDEKFINKITISLEIEKNYKSIFNDIQENYKGEREGSYNVLKKYGRQVISSIYLSNNDNFDEDKFKEIIEVVIEKHYNFDASKLTVNKNDNNFFKRDDIYDNMSR